MGLYTLSANTFINVFRNLNSLVTSVFLKQLIIMNILLIPIPILFLLYAIISASIHTLKNDYNYIIFIY